MRDYGQCSVAGCSSRAVNKGRMLCKAHLHKFYAHGDPAVGRRKTDSGWGEGHTCGTHGYRFISDRGARREHIVVAEKALGRPLPPEAIVHHVDEDRANNANSNLVVCPDRAYHNLLHQRMRARDACGNPSWRKCCRCGQYDDPANMGISGSQAYHRECNAAHVRRINQEKRHG